MRFLLDGSVCATHCNSLVFMCTAVAWTRHNMSQSVTQNEVYGTRVGHPSLPYYTGHLTPVMCSLGSFGRGVSCRACRTSNLELEPPAQRSAQLPRQGDVGARSSPPGCQCGPRARGHGAPARIGDQRSPKNSFTCRFGLRDCDRSTVEVSGRPACRQGLV